MKHKIKLVSNKENPNDLIVQINENGVRKFIPLESLGFSPLEAKLLPYGEIISKIKRVLKKGC
jgi:hypothetical protein